MLLFLHFSKNETELRKRFFGFAHINEKWAYISLTLNYTLLYFLTRCTQELKAVNAHFFIWNKNIVFCVCNLIRGDIKVDIFQIVGDRKEFVFTVTWVFKIFRFFSQRSSIWNYANKIFFVASNDWAAFYQLVLKHNFLWLELIVLLIWRGHWSEI